jgi:hypothetical protein
VEEGWDLRSKLKNRFIKVCGRSGCSERFFSGYFSKLIHGFSKKPKIKIMGEDDYE